MGTLEQTIGPIERINRFPRTRYQGSKRKLAANIVGALGDLHYQTVLDAFGGTGAVAYAFKCMGKSVTYNDILAFNHQIGLALIENGHVPLTVKETDTLGRRAVGRYYPTFIQDTFDGVYFTRAENEWLDAAVTNIGRLEHPYRRSIAWFALCQAALAKRPYNLFHRRNLYMRTAAVPRSFGNKATWDRSFEHHCRVAVAEANAALIDTGVPCRAMCADVMSLDPAFDLVYIDTPYIRHSGVGVDYRDFYHFLEGMLHYDQWTDMIDLTSKHLRLVRKTNPWCVPTRCRSAFRDLFDRFRESILVVSYRSDGVPSIDELRLWLGDAKRTVRVVDTTSYQYALSKNRSSREVLLIATD